MRYITYIITSLIILIGCNAKEKDCEKANFKELKIRDISISLKLPDYKIVDTVKYGNKTVLNYKIKSIDSILNVIILVRSQDDFPPEPSNMNHIMTIQKGEIESGQNKKMMVAETFKKIGDVKVGYLKYLVEQQNVKFFSGRIFFYKNDKLVELWLLEKYRNPESIKYSLIDCVLESIKLN